MDPIRGRMLTATDLIQSRCKVDRVLPIIGSKDFRPSHSWLENKQIQSTLDERKSLLEEERIERWGTLARAEWCPSAGLAEVTYRVGKHWQTMGHETAGKLQLYPEEALFLLENNHLEIIYGGAAMSVQQAYTLLLAPHTSCSLDEYRTYAHLNRQGYRVVRHTSSHQLTRYELQIRLHQHTFNRKTKRSACSGQPCDVSIRHADNSNSDVGSVNEDLHSEEFPQEIIDQQEKTVNTLAPQATEMCVTGAAEAGNTEKTDKINPEVCDRGITGDRVLPVDTETASEGCSSLLKSNISSDVKCAVDVSEETAELHTVEDGAPCNNSTAVKRRWETLGGSEPSGSSTKRKARGEDFQDKLSSESEDDPNLVIVLSGDEDFEGSVKLKDEQDSDIVVDNEDILVIDLEDDQQSAKVSRPRRHLDRMTILNSILGVNGKTVVKVDVPPNDLLPDNIRPKQKTYCINMWRLYAAGVGGKSVHEDGRNVTQSPSYQQSHDNGQRFPKKRWKNHGHRQGSNRQAHDNVAYTNSGFNRNNNSSSVSPWLPWSSDFFYSRHQQGLNRNSYLGSQLSYRPYNGGSGGAAGGSSSSSSSSFQVGSVFSQTASSFQMFTQSYGVNGCETFNTRPSHSSYTHQPHWDFQSRFVNYQSRLENTMTSSYMERSSYRQPSEGRYDNRVFADSTGRFHGYTPTGMRGKPDNEPRNGSCGNRYNHFNKRKRKQCYKNRLNREGGNWNQSVNPKKPKETVDVIQLDGDEEIEEISSKSKNSKVENSVSQLTNENSCESVSIKPNVDGLRDVHDEVVEIDDLRQEVMDENSCDVLEVDDVKVQLQQGTFNGTQKTKLLKEKLTMNDKCNEALEKKLSPNETLTAEMQDNSCEEIQFDDSKEVLLVDSSCDVVEMDSTTGLLVGDNFHKINMKQRVEIEAEDTSCEAVHISESARHEDREASAQIKPAVSNTSLNSVKMKLDFGDKVTDEHFCEILTSDETPVKDANKRVLEKKIVDVPFENDICEVADVDNEVIENGPCSRDTLNSKQTSVVSQLCENLDVCSAESSCETSKLEDQINPLVEEDVASVLQQADCTDIDNIFSKLQIISSVSLKSLLRSDVEETRLEISFDLYLPSTVFRKAEYRLPDYRVCVLGYEESVPCMEEMVVLLSKFEDDVPLLFAVVLPDTISFFHFASLYNLEPKDYN